MPKKPTSESLKEIDSYHLDGIFYFRKHAKLPRICLFTGKPVSTSELPYVYKYQSTPILKGFIIIIAKLLFGLLAAFLKDPTSSVTLRFHLSPETKLKIKKRKRVLIYFLLSIVALFISTIIDRHKSYSDITGPLFVFSIIASIIWHFRFNKPFSKLRFKNEFFSLKGTHPKFRKAVTQLDQLPSISFRSVQPTAIKMHVKKGTRDFRPSKLK